MLKQLVLMDVSVSPWSPQRFSFPFAQQIGEDSPCSSAHTGPSMRRERAGNPDAAPSPSPCPCPGKGGDPDVAPNPLPSGPLASSHPPVCRRCPGLRTWDPSFAHLCGECLEGFSLVQFSSVVQSCPTLCNPMNRSTPGLLVHHQLPEFTQTHVHWVCDAIQLSHPLSSPSPPAPNPSQHQGLFQWVDSSHEVAKVLEFQLQHQSFQWTPRTDLL